MSSHKTHTPPVIRRRIKIGKGKAEGSRNHLLFPFSSQCLNPFKEKSLVRLLLSGSLACAMLIRNTVVTGSSRSIGAAVVKRLAHDGASVVINYASNEAAAKEVADDINRIRSGAAVIVKADISSVESCKYLLDETLKAFGRIDILVLNAGIMGMKTLREIDEKFFDDHFLVNVKGPFFLVQAAEPHLKEGKWRDHLVLR